MYIKNVHRIKRKTIDKYYTIQSVVDKCMEFIQDKINIGEDDLCIEPSAGNGAFIEGIKALLKNMNFMI